MAFGITELYAYSIFVVRRKEKEKTVQTQLASLLLIVSTVALASVVIGFAVAISEQTLSLDNNPQINQIKSLQDKMLNETNLWLDDLHDIMANQTLPSEP